MTGQYHQQATGAMAYPTSGTLNRVLFKTPLIWWRMGLGPLMGRGAFIYPMLLLTTWGRKSCLPRHTLLSATALNGTMYVGAGWGERADWVRNLQADPHVTVQLGYMRSNPPYGPVYYALARRVTDLDEFTSLANHLLETGGDSHMLPYLQSLGIEFNLDDLIAKRQRLYQFALEPTDQPGPPPMEVDLKWVWAAMSASFALGWLTGWLVKKSK